MHESVKERPAKLVLLDRNDALLEAANDLEMLPYIKSRVVNSIKLSDKHFWEKLRYALPAEIQQRCNNYTLHHHYPAAVATAPTLDRMPKLAGGGEVSGLQPERQGQGILPQGLPLYYHDTEANYSSATTATPSPLGRRGVGPGLEPMSDAYHQQQTVVGHRHHRPPSEHIYFSIDSDYNAEVGQSSNDVLMSGANSGNTTYAPHGASTGQQWRVLTHSGNKPSSSGAQQPYMV